MTYVLNKNQKQLIAGYQLKEICDFLKISQQSLAHDLGITVSELQNLFAGNMEFKPDHQQTYLQAVMAKVKEVFDFVEHKQAHEDVNGYASEQELEDK